MLHRFHTTAASTLFAFGLIGSLSLVGCKHDKPEHQKVELKSLYPELPPKEVLPIFKDTIYSLCDVTNNDYFQISGYGVVVNLNGTGDSKAPNLVRQYIIEEMFKHRVGSATTDIHTPSPEAMLRDPRVAIVQVDGFLPPGVRKGERFDVQVSALPDNDTTSLAGGDLLQTELRIFGANPADPRGAVNVFARGEGPLFVNPAYALDPKAPSDPRARSSLRLGVAMNGAHSLEDRPIGLRLRSPSMRLSRYIEDRIDSRFQEMKPDTIAAAQDEGIVSIYVPTGYQGDWQHFAGVVKFLYLDPSPGYSANKAKELADAAVKPDAPLMEISYAWEGLGKAALPVILERNLMSNANPGISYAAARAAAFIGESAAQQALVNIARSPTHEFRINAIHDLGEMRNSPAINEMVRPLLDSDQSLVRLEAYRMLMRNGDPSINQISIKDKFAIDVVRCNAAPTVYATRTGEPRIAVMGNKPQLQMPITFTAMDGRLSISSDKANRYVTIFYRPAEPPGGVHTRDAARQLEPISIVSSPDLAEIVARLGGQGGDGTTRKLSFNYGQIVSILSVLTGQQQIVASAGGSRLPASFILQELPGEQKDIYAAPVIPDQGRPQTDEPGKIGLAK